MAANQIRAATALIGYAALNTGNASSLALSSAATWVAFQFVPEQDKTLDGVRLYMVTKTGTLVGDTTIGDLSCEIYSDVNGIPSASIETKKAGTAPASGNWVSWTGFTTALTAGVAYWLVFKNLNVTPGSNYPTYQWGGVTISGSSSMGFGSTSNLNVSGVMYGWNKVHTTNSGTAWASSVQNGVAGPRIGYSDATYDGLPASDMSRAGNQSSGDRAYGKQEVGVKFSVPANAAFRIIGIAFQLQKVSTPGALRFRLYQGTTLLGTTHSIAAANVTTANAGDWYTAFFASPISIVSTNNPFRAVFGDATSGDASTVGYQPPLITIDSDSNSQALKPMNGTLSKTVCVDNTAVSFTDTTTQIMPFVLLLDTGGEFTAAGGSSTFIGVGTKTGGRL